MSKAARGRLTHDNELKLIGQLFDLVALLHPTRRQWALEYLTSRLDDMPVLARIEAPADDDPVLFVRSATGTGRDGT
jgi:hypothetical protein